jgi:hypothetical protein
MDHLCCNCHRVFPRGLEYTVWLEGEVRELILAPRRVRKLFREYLIEGITPYLCGACYFHLTDD